jgi:hypothetical protein
MTDNSGGGSAMSPADRAAAEIKTFGDRERTDIAQRAVDSPVRSIRSWEVVPMDAVSIGNGTLGFVRVSGSVDTESGTASWSAIVKAMGANTWGEYAGSNSPAREVDAYRSGFFERLDSGLVSVPCYGVTDRPDGSTWLWLKDLTGAADPPWDRSQFLSVARHVGQFNGAWPESRAPDFDWLDRGGATGRWNVFLAAFADTFDLLLDNLDHPLVGRVAQRVGSGRIARLRDDFQTLTGASAGLPRSVAHNDCHARNLFPDIDRNGHEVTYAIDWAAVGLAPVGVDGGSVTGASLTWGRDEAVFVGGAEKELFEAYMTGLTDSGWEGERSDVRLAYLSTVAFYVIAIALRGPLIGIESERRAWALARAGVPADEALDEAAERLEMFIPLVDEGLELAAHRA